jgi:hypothetical protein
MLMRGMGSDRWPAGLNLAEPTITTQAEIDERKATSNLKFGMGQPGFEFWLDHKPEVLKRYRMWVDTLRAREGNDSADTWMPPGVAIFIIYAATGYDEGIRYAIRLCHRTATQDQMLERLALASRYSAPLGMATIAHGCAKFPWTEPTAQLARPDGWAPDPEAFKSGADFSKRDVTPEEVRKILDWYERWIGEVPQHIDLLAHYRPGLLKAYRSWCENSLTLLPKQTEPYTLLVMSITRGFAGGIREGLLLGRAFGIARARILDAISWGTFHGGVESLSLLSEVGRDILDSWPE